MGDIEDKNIFLVLYDGEKGLIKETLKKGNNIESELWGSLTKTKIITCSESLADKCINAAKQGVDDQKNSKNIATSANAELIEKLGDLNKSVTHHYLSDGIKSVMHLCFEKSQTLNEQDKMNLLLKYPFLAEDVASKKSQYQEALKVLMENAASEKNAGLSHILMHYLRL